MKRLKFINKVGNDGIQNKYIIGSGIGSQSRFVKTALKKRSSNNSTGKCCDFKITSSIKSLIISYVVTNINLSDLDNSEQQALINQIKTDYANNLNISRNLIIINLTQGSLIIHVTIKSETPNLENIKNVINNNANINNNVKDNIKTFLDNIISGEVEIDDPTISEEVLPSKTEICITPISIVNIVSSPTGNKYVFNNSSTYNPFFKYTLNNGYYEFTNISSSHPIAILNAGKTNLITYTGDNKRFNETLNGTTADGNYDFYDGTIKVYVYGDFGSVSVYCYHHGYMGGENLLTYKNSCSSNPINSPTMTITSSVNNGDTSNHASISLTFTSSVATTNFVQGDITVTNGSISSFDGSGTTYTATFTPSGVGATTINVGAGVYTDAIGNNNIAASEFNWTYNNTQPTMTITSSVDDGDTSNHASISLTFTSSVATTNFVQGDITVTNGVISNFATTSSTDYTATFTPSAEGPTTIKVEANTYTDSIGNNNLATSVFNWNYALSSSSTYNIDVVGYNYYYTLSGTDREGSVSGDNTQVDLKVNAGDTVNFNVSMNSGSHPFFIKNSSTDFDVTLDSGNQGTTNDTLTWTPSASGNYYYICGSHSSMRGDIIVRVN